MGKVEYCRADVTERLLTMPYIKNADVNKFEELQSQQSLNNDQYPRTVLAAQVILEDWDKSYNDQQQKYSQDVTKAARDGLHSPSHVSSRLLSSPPLSS
jgi:hypothetical protein